MADSVQHHHRVSLAPSTAEPKDTTTDTDNEYVHVNHDEIDLSDNASDEHESNYSDTGDDKVIVSFTVKHNSAGEYDGSGVITYSNGDTLEGTWINGELHGDTVYTNINDDISVHAKYSQGSIIDLVYEYDTIDNEIIYHGEYNNNIPRNGHGTLISSDGSKLIGTFVNGKFTGEHNKYIYSGFNDRYSLQGTFIDNTMIESRFYIDDKLDETNQNVYMYDPPSNEYICKHLLLPDPLEQHTVYVSQSLLPNGNDGLFAKIDLPKNTIVAYYNGIHLDQSIADARDWSLNTNTLAYDELNNISLDIPIPYDDIHKYNATLGHKINSVFHRDQINCVYSTCYHARFGRVRCIQTIQPIPKNNELYVNYGFELGIENNKLLTKLYSQLKELDIESDTEIDNNDNIDDVDITYIEDSYSSDDDDIINHQMNCPIWYTDTFNQYIQALQKRIDQHQHQ